MSSLFMMFLSSAGKPWDQAVSVPRNFTVKAPVDFVKVPLNLKDPFAFRYLRVPPLKVARPETEKFSPLWSGQAVPPAGAITKLSFPVAVVIEPGPPNVPQGSLPTPFPTPDNLLLPTGTVAVPSPVTDEIVATLSSILTT